MLERIKSSFACLLHKHCHSDSDDMDEHHKDLFPLPSDNITTYCWKLVMMNNTIGTNRLQSYRISEFHGFKTHALSKHEYGSANVLVPGTGEKTFPLSFERMQGKKTIDVDTTSSKSPDTQPEASNLQVVEVIHQETNLTISCRTTATISLE